MTRSMLVATPCLVLSLVLVSVGCRPRSPTTPEETPRWVPVTQEDPIEGDPSDIEGEEIGEEHMDDAQVVEPGPAEAEVQKRDSMRWPD